MTYKDNFECAFNDWLEINHPDEDDENVVKQYRKVFEAGWSSAMRHFNYALEHIGLTMSAKNH